MGHPVELLDKGEKANPIEKTENFQAIIPKVANEKVNFYFIGI